MSTQKQQADVVVIGAGPGGYVCAIRLAQLGKKVTVIEKENVGGVCLNIGCIPSKALIHCGNTYEKMNHASEMGLELSGKVKVNMPQMMKYKEGVVKKLTGGVGGLLKGNGCTVINGTAEFINHNTLKIKTATEEIEMTFNQCVIATGSSPTAIPSIPVDQKIVLDSTGALSQDTVPETMLCIGGGYIGLELGTFYSKVGTKVTVVEAQTSLLGMLDPDVTQVVQKKLVKNGVEIKLGTFVKAVKNNGKNAEVTLEKDGKQETLKFDKVLVTVGRVPNSKNLGLEKAGVKVDDKGFIHVGPTRLTNIPNIYAIGDIAGQPLLAHKASKEGIVCAEAIAGMKTIYDVIAMPAVIFTDPEIATVGLNEAECKQKQMEYISSNFPFAANGRALSVNESDGFVKIIGDKRTGKLLGVHIVGPEASNLISEAALALEMGCQVEDIALTVHPHPTLGEMMMEGAEATLGHAIHIIQKKPSAASRSSAQPHA
jgi:dihydrolipoamide dehydrogenase